ncbi:MAG: type II secretion system protein GspM [Betaproteobacteria bacterium]
MNLATTVRRARDLWQARQPRERALLVAALSLVMVALLWSAALGPAWRLWSQAPAKRLQADQQHSAMLTLQAQAQALQKQARIEPTQSRQALAQSVKALGAQLGAEGPRTTVELPRVPIAALAPWLQALGPQMGARVVQATLQEVEPGFWAGRLTLELP